MQQGFRVIPMSPQTISSWWDDKDDLDLDPVYQRKGHIWSDRQKQDLIDTILNGFDIPKLYFADFTLLDSGLNEKRRKYAVIDGKQRLLSIFGFFEGQFNLAKTFVYFDDPALSLGVLSYKDIESTYPRISRKFSNYSLAIMSVVTDDEARISELFLRLNASKPLTGAEIRNAMLGEVPALIRELAEHPFWPKARFSKTRGQDKNTAAKLLLLEHTGSFVDTKKSQLDRLVDLARARGGDDASDEAVSDEATDQIIIDDVVDKAEDTESSDIRRSAERVKAVLDRLTPLFSDNDPTLAQQAQIPVIYWLARELPDRLGRLREFLVRFDEERRRNRQTEIEDPKRDPVLVDYELMTRTSNDQSSIGGRYRILRQRYEKFIN